MVRSSIADRYLQTLESASLENAPKSPPKSIRGDSPTKSSPVKSPFKESVANRSVESPVKKSLTTNRSTESPVRTKLGPQVNNNKKTSQSEISAPKVRQSDQLTPKMTNLSLATPQTITPQAAKSQAAASQAVASPKGASPNAKVSASPSRANLGPRPDRNPLMHNQDLTPSQVSWDKERKNWSAYEYLCHITEAKEWVEKILGEEQPPAELFPDSLQNGVALAKIVQKLRPQLMKWPIFEHKRLQYRHTENITLFFDLLEDMHIPQLFQFDMTDLYEKRNLPKVIYCLHAISHFIAETEAVSAVDNLVGKLQFSDDQLNTTERGMAGQSMPNFGAMTRQLSGKHGKIDIPNDELEDEVEDEVEEAHKDEIEDEPSYAYSEEEDSFRRRDSFSDEEDNLPLPPVRGSNRSTNGRGRRYLSETDSEFSVAGEYIHSDSDDSMLDLVPPRRYKAQHRQSRHRDPSSSLDSLRRVSRDLFNERRRPHNYRNFSSTGSLRSRVLSSAELMLMELESLEPEIAQFQALCRGRLARLHTDNHKTANAKFAASLQAIARGKLTRQRLARQHLTLDDEQLQSLVGLQSLLRAQLVRREYNVTATRASTLAPFQGLARGLLLRRRIAALKQNMESKPALKSITALQSAFRGVFLRFRLGCVYDDLDQHIREVVKLQSHARGALARKQRSTTQEKWATNIDKIILIQSVWRARAQGARYRTLIFDSNPTLESIKPFLHLIDDKPEDYERELELESIMKDIGRKVRENEQLEARVDQLDMKISLLVKNNISIDELLLHQNRDLRNQIMHEKQLGQKLGLRGNGDSNNTASKRLAVSSDTGLKEQFDPNSLQKASRERIEMYQGLFYVLQTQPSYFTRLMANKPPRSLDMTELTLAAFGNAETAREKFFLLRQLAHTITQSTVGSPENTVAWCIVAQLNKREAGVAAAKKILAPATEKLKACYDQLLEYDPHFIYEHLTGGADLSAEEAIQDPAVRALFVQNLQRLREISMALVQSLAKHMSELPFHIKFLAREVYQEVLKITRDRKEAMVAVGQVVVSQFVQPALLAADSLELVDAAAGNTSKNLVLVSRVIHQIGLMAPFDANSGSTDVYLQPLNEFVKSSAHHLSLQFQPQIVECDDISTHYSYSELDDITMHDRPLLNISMDHILALHYMSFQHIASVAPESDSMLKPIIEKLGPLPKDAREMLDLARFKEIQLELNPRYGTASLNASTQGSSSLLVTTKRCLGYVLRVQSSQPDLMSVLIAPVELEDEHQYNILLDTDNTREVAAELANLTFRELKLLTLEKVLELESSGGVSRKDGYQGLINAIADDIRNKDTLRQQRVRNIEMKRKTLEGLTEKCDFLQRRLETYNTHIESALTTLQAQAHQANLAKGKRGFQGFQRFQLPKAGGAHGNSHSHGQGVMSSEGPQFGQYKTTADKLYERGILIRLRGYEDRQRKDVQFVFSCDKVSVFQIDISYKGILLPNGSIQITLDDMLSHQYQNHGHILLMNNELQLSTNRLLQLICHKFFGVV